MKYKIYLDDVRTPTDSSWVVVRNYDEFVNKVTEIGLENIELISLDHDLGDSAMKEWHTNDFRDEFEAVNLSVLQPWSVTLNVTGQRGNLIKLLESYESMPMYPVVSQVSYNNKVIDGRTAFSIKLTIFHIEETQFFD